MDVAAQCPFDYNMDGTVNYDGDFIIHLGQFGMTEADLEEGEELFTDHNQNGVSDFRDLLGLTEHLGTLSCLESLPWEDCSNDLVLETYEVHTNGFSDDYSAIPPGSVTYRLFLATAFTNSDLSGVYGDSLSPMWISCPTGIFQHPFGGGMALDVNPDILTIAPAAKYTSFLSMGSWFDSCDPNFGYLIEWSEDNWYNQFLSGSGFTINSPIGGGMVGSAPLTTCEPVVPGLIFLGQFTVIGSMEISGSLNIQLRDYQGFSTEPSVCQMEGLTFNSENAQIFGCINTEAMNFDPMATFDDSSCVAYGDFNGDGEVDVADVLQFLNEFGCVLDCSYSDLNGDGVVNVFDLLLLLGYLG